jgi:tetratricopeptide (TPR) repeat protein
MKKLLLSLTTLILLSSFGYSQEDPEKALSKAGRALGSFNLDPANNAGKLDEAIDMIEVAVKDNTVAGKAKAWQTRGEIFLAVSDQDMGKIAVDPEAKPKHPDAPVKAAESFMKALELAEKKYETKDALKGLKDVGNKLNVVGNSQIGSEDYAGAFTSFNTVLKVDELLRKNGESPITPDAELANQKFVVAYCAQASGNTAKAKELYKTLVDEDIDEALVYSQYFNLLMAEGKSDDALVVLEKGRKKYPQNTEILFAEINYYIQQQRFDVLETKLKEAIEREPNNPSVYSALGNVYMNLHNQEFEKDLNSEQAKKYFQNALDYFNQAIKIDPKQFDAIYSIGSLYFNKAVGLQKAANNLGMSKEDQEKYKKYTEEIHKLMETSLPYFQKTESMDPNDTNTLIALSEIYARLEDFEKVKEFKARLDNVKNNVKNSSSYFKQ